MLSTGERAGPDERMDRMATTDMVMPISDDIVPTKSAYALLGSLAVSLMLWVGAYALLT